MMEALSRQLGFPYRRCGALVLCFNETDIPRLEELKARGECNGVEGLTVLDRDALRRQEPRVSPEAVAALYAPTSAIICPFGMTIALAENAAANGCEFRFDTEVQRIRRQNGGFLLETSRGPLESRTVICVRVNCTSSPAAASTACWTAAMAAWRGTLFSSFPPPWARACW